MRTRIVLLVAALIAAMVGIVAGPISPANAACTMSGLTTTSRVWVNGSCGGNNQLINSSSNSVTFNDAYSAAEVGYSVSMLYLYQNGGRAGCRKDIHGGTYLNSLGNYSTCGGTSANDDVSSVKQVNA